MNKLARFRTWHLGQQPVDPYAGRRAANAVYVPGRRQFVRGVGSDLHGEYREEWCELCEQHVSRHFTDGRPTYFCDQEVDP
jgi:hypothetical protein